VDTQTRHALKKDNFASATASSVDWLSMHRSGFVRLGIIVGVIVIVCAASLIFWYQRSSAADSALGAALDTYTASIAIGGEQAGNGVYATAADRSKAANQQFTAIANKYGWLPQGARAHYFAGITYKELGQNAQAESELKIAAGSWNRNLSSLANLALAGLYEQTGREAKAIEVLTDLGTKPSETVPTVAAQLELANLYAATGKQDQARVLWAKVKDADKDGTAGAIAAEKLSSNTGDQQ
jgi:tetratricopeptide (TPR) repeat protein